LISEGTEVDPNGEDLVVLEALRAANPVTFTTADGAPYALADSIPRGVLEAFEALTPSVKYVKARAAWCLKAGDWFSCRERLISKLMKRMASRSLELGFSSDQGLLSYRLGNRW
jgi:hypothetical protein